MCRLFFIAMKLIALGGKRGGGKFAKVDDDKYEWLNECSWHVNARGYAAGRRADIGWDKMVLMHRLVLNAKAGEMVDHKNRDTFDNQESNLRFCNKSGNGANMKPLGGVSQYKGVTYLRPKRNEKKPWVAQIKK